MDRNLYGKLLITILCLLLPSSLVAQESAPKPKNCVGPSGFATGWYYQEVIDRATRPPDWNRSLISISINSDFHAWKVVIREINGKFEVLDGTPEADIYTHLKELDSVCQLSPNPAVTAENVKFKWRQTEISSLEFEQLHHAFLSALSQQVSEAETEHSRLLVEKTRPIYLHAGQLHIVYDNWTQHLETQAWEVKDRSGNENPVVIWARRVFDRAGVKD
jgi:hypothetical protein